MQKSRLSRIDNFKWIAALLVAANHTSPLENLSVSADFLLTRVLARIAVPFFLMVTGYFVLSPYASNAGEKKRGKLAQICDSNRVLRSIKKTALLYLAATVLYLPIQIYKFVQSMNTTAVTQGVAQNGATVAQETAQNGATTTQGAVDMIGAVLKSIFFDGTYYHLWYLPAVILGLGIVFLLLKYIPKQAMIVTVVLYVLGLLGDSYYGVTARIAPLKTIYDGIFTVFSYTRNGLFMAPLFLLLGREVAVRKQKYLDEEEDAEKEAYRNLWNALIALVFMSLEALLLLHGDMQKHDSMYLLLPVCMWYLFLFLTKEENRNAQNSYQETKEHGLESHGLEKRHTKQTNKGIFFYEGPMIFYIVHPFAILVVRALVKLTKLQIFLTIGTLYYPAVVGCGLCGTYLVLLGRKYVKKWWKGKKTCI